jgi:hypothetical protein
MKEDYRLLAILLVWCIGVLFGLYGGSASQNYPLGAIGGAITAIVFSAAIWVGLKPEESK